MKKFGLVISSLILIGVCLGTSERTYASMAGVSDCVTAVAMFNGENTPCMSNGGVYSGKSENDKTSICKLTCQLMVASCGWEDNPDIGNREIEYCQSKCNSCPVAPDTPEDSGIEKPLNETIPIVEVKPTPPNPGSCGGGCGECQALKTESYDCHGEGADRHCQTRQVCTNVCNTEQYTKTRDGVSSDCFVARGVGWQGNSLTCRSRIDYVEDKETCNACPGHTCSPGNAAKPESHLSELQKIGYISLITSGTIDFADYIDNSIIKLNFDRERLDLPNKSDDSAPSVVGSESVASDFTFTPSGVCRNQMELTGWDVKLTSLPFSDGFDYNFDPVIDGGGIISQLPFSTGGVLEFKVTTPAAPNPVKEHYVPDNSSLLEMTFNRPMIASLILRDDNKLKLGTAQNMCINMGLPEGSRLSIEPRANDLKVLGVASNLRLFNTNASNFELKKWALSGYLYLGVPYNERPEGAGFLINYIGTDLFTNMETFGVETAGFTRYNLGDKQVSYLLCPHPDIKYPCDYLSMGNGVYQGVKILGLVQAQGRQSKALENYKNSSVDTYQARATIKNNIYKLIRDMKSGDKLKGLFYKDLGNSAMTLSQLKQTYNMDGVETIVLKNGNFIIDSDISNRLGIIVINDTGNENLGNIFVTKNVTYINALIYADGGIISAYTTLNTSSFNISNYANSTVRTKDLENQLVIKGALFTRNTVGGAILTDEQTYVLPGGKVVQKTDTNYNKALAYDLAFFRTGVENADNTRNNGYTTYPLVVVFDTTYQNNPPIGFNI